MAAEASEVSAQAAGAPPASVHERMKSFLSGPAPVQDQSKADSLDEAPEQVAESGSAAPAAKQVPDQAQEPADQAEAADDVQSEDAQSEDWQPSTIEELAEGLQWESDKLMSLPVKVKIDGKEGTATLRDLVKSYQLDGHINQKLASVDMDRKALMADQTKFQGERADKLLRLDAGIQTLERALLGEFQAVDWNKLATEDPVAYNAKYVDFQQRNAYLTDIGQQIAHERGIQQQHAQEAQAHRLAEERQLMLAKVPEWANEGVRQKDRAEIGEALESVGITKAEFEAIDDHRYALVARGFAKWVQLQKSKPATLNKVKAAPKLLKPGTQQSKDAINRSAMDKDRARLRQTGRTQDAVPALKRLLFSQQGQGR